MENAVGIHHEPPVRARNLVQMRNFIFLIPGHLHEHLAQLGNIHDIQNAHTLPYGNGISHGNSTPGLFQFNYSEIQNLQFLADGKNKIPLQLKPAGRIGGGQNDLQHHLHAHQRPVLDRKPGKLRSRNLQFRSVGTGHR